MSFKLITVITKFVNVRRLLKAWLVFYSRRVVFQLFGLIFSLQALPKTPVHGSVSEQYAYPIRSV
jgi:hypothetical protein